MRIALSSPHRSGLDAFVRRERAVLLSAVFLAATMHLAAQAVHVAPKRDLAQGLARVNAFLEHENKLAKRWPAAKPGAAVAAHPNSDSAPALVVTRLVSAAAAQEVEVGGVAPDSADGDQFKAQITGDFRATVRFLARLERLHVAIKGFEITPADGGHLRSTLAVELGPDALDPVRARALELPELSSLINPFAQRACTDPVPADKAAETARINGKPMKLSAVTQLGAQSLATINGLDYRVGDPVGGYRIASIGPDSVRLAGEGAGPAACLVLTLPAILSGDAPAGPAVP